MGKSLLKSGYSFAKSLVKDKKVVTPDSWNPPTAETEDAYIKENGIEAFGKWHLGIDESADKETKGAYGYIFTSDFKNIDREGLRAIRQRAGQQEDTDIFNAAGKVIDIIDGKSLDDENIATKFFEVKADTVEVLRNERSIVHFISTPDIDRGDDVVDPNGMIDTDFAKSPSVWYNHNYMWNPSATPVAKSLWRRKQKDGVLAKTQFAEYDFANDIYNLHVGGFIGTWSIGFTVDPSQKGAYNFDATTGISYINIWNLFEYSSAPLAMNPNCLDQMKSLIKSVTGKNIIQSLETKDLFEQRLTGMVSEITELKKNYDALNALLQSKDVSEAQLKNDIEEIKKLVTKQETEIKDNVSPNLETVGNITEEQLKSMLSGVIAGAVRKLTGKE